MATQALLSLEILIVVPTYRTRMSDLPVMPFMPDFACLKGCRPLDAHTGADALQVGHDWRESMSPVRVPIAGLEGSGAGRVTISAVLDSRLPRCTETIWVVAAFQPRSLGEPGWCKRRNDAPGYFFGGLGLRAYRGRAGGQLLEECGVEDAATWRTSGMSSRATSCTGGRGCAGASGRSSTRGLRTSVMRDQAVNATALNDAVADGEDPGWPSPRCQRRSTSRMPTVSGTGSSSSVAACAVRACLMKPMVTDARSGPLSSDHASPVSGSTSWYWDGGTGVGESD